MYALFHGVPWSHVVPALFSVVFAFLFLKIKQVYFKVLIGLLWFLFISNTAYIFIDISRISLHWNSLNTFGHTLLILQFFLLETIGLASFLYSMLPFESIIRARKLSQNQQITAIILFNIFISIGMVIGRMGHSNSYIVFTNPSHVFSIFIYIILSLKMMSLVVLYGIVVMGVYLVLRIPLIRYTKKLL